MDTLITRAAKDLISSKHAIALTGAGISTESGIPDFRGPSGVWTKNPQAEKRAYLSYQRFSEDPSGWWRERLSEPGSTRAFSEAEPNTGHQALAELEAMGIIQCVITQNVDALHEKAGTNYLLKYHGSVMRLRCVSCSTRFDRDTFDLDQLLRDNLLPPHCPKCEGVVKTDSVAFGEPIPSDIARQSLIEAEKCDLMLICGTSAVVYPFAQLPRIARHRSATTQATNRADIYTKDNDSAVTIIEVNAEPTPLTEEGISDYLISGKTGEILPNIVAEVRSLELKMLQSEKQ